MAAVWNKDALDSSRRILQDVKKFYAKKQVRTKFGIKAKKGRKSFTETIVLKNGDEIIVFVELISDPSMTTEYVVMGGCLGDIDDNIFQIELLIYINPISFPKALNNINAEIRETLRHEIEHTQQSAGKRKVSYEDFGNNLSDYLLAKHEQAAFLAGFLKHAKFKKRTMNQIIKNYLNIFDEYSLPDKEKEKVYKQWIKYGKKIYPRAIWE